MKNENISVVIPAYNEADSIASVIRQIRKELEKAGKVFEIIVVNDGSTDGTGEAAEGVSGTRLITHKKNYGYGSALKTGIKEAKYELVLITDADGTYPAEEIPKLLQYAGKYGMVVGARKALGAGFPLQRAAARWILSSFANFLSGEKIPDINSGLRLFRKDIAMSYFDILPSGFSFTTTITLACLNKKIPIKFVPIGYRRRSGKSKIRPLRDFLNFFILIIRTTIYFKPPKVFFPLALLSLTLAIIFLAAGTMFSGLLFYIVAAALFLASALTAFFGLHSPKEPKAK